MKRFLIIFLLMIPTLVLSVSLTTNQNDTSVVSQDYNKAFTDYLVKSIKNKSFANGEKFFKETVVVYSYSLEEFGLMDRKDIIGFFDEMVKTTQGYNYEIYYQKDGDTTIYTMKYYYMYLDGEDIKYGDITFFLSETNGKIDTVYGP